MDATFSQPLPATRSEPAPALNFLPAGGDGPLAGTLSIVGKRGTVRYAVAEFPTGWDGRGFVLAKVDGGGDKTEERYSCFVARNGQDRQCECKGFYYAGHCKHLDAVAALIRSGQL